MTKHDLLKTAKPILFNTEMVRAILDARKTVTRRVVKGIIPEDAQFGYTFFTPEAHISCRGIIEIDKTEKSCEKFFKFPYQKGDILYVRETFRQYEKAVGEAETWHVEKFWAYKADEKNNNIQKSCEWYDGPWRPSIHMPKEAARIFLRVTDVRVERLQDITEDDCVDEGVEDVGCPYCHTVWMGDHVSECWVENQCSNPNGCECDDVILIKNFSKTWDSTIKKIDMDRYGWAANPCVWVVEFERVEV